MRGFVAIFSVAAVFVCAVLRGDERTGEVFGRVTDARGAIVSDATVEISGPALQGVRSVATDSKGRFRVLALPPGDAYRVSVRVGGFAPTVIRDVSVHLGRETVVDVEMQPAVIAFYHR